MYTKKVKKSAIFEKQALVDEFYKDWGDNLNLNYYKIDIDGTNEEAKYILDIQTKNINPISRLEMFQQNLSSFMNTDNINLEKLAQMQNKHTKRRWKPNHER